MRKTYIIYLTVLSDHEGCNVSAHTTHLVGSALSDPYLSFSAGLNGLAGPLHGLANQECLRFLLDFQAKYGKKWNENDIRQFVADTLASGKVVPGYGHAVLRQTDPRFMCELEFANRYIKNDNLVDLVKACYRVIPDALAATGKVSNPWPLFLIHIRRCRRKERWRSRSYAINKKKKRKRTRKT